MTVRGTFTAHSGNGHAEPGRPRTAYLPGQQLTSWGHGIALLAKDLLN
jgi:hypothetical protein